jgi:hypothetical protein
MFAENAKKSILLESLKKAISVAIAEHIFPSE